MRTFLINLLIVFALALCGLCTFQWVRETKIRDRIAKTNEFILQRELAIQSYTNSIRTMDQQIIQKDTQLGELKSTVESNLVVITKLKQETNNLGRSNDVLSDALKSYTNAYHDVTNRLQKAYDDIRKQNESLKEVVAQREDYVKKLNDAIKERNEIVAQYNDLVERVKKLQEAAAQPPKGTSGQKPAPAQPPKSTPGQKPGPGQKPTSQ